MRRRSRIGRYLAAFSLLYVLLLLPWPGLNAAYGRFFRFLGNAAFGSQGPERIVTFAPSPSAAMIVPVRVTLANPARADPEGRAPARIVDLDARGIGWVPTALFSALVVATPIPWRRRFVALGLGMLLIHAFILFSVGAYLMNPAATIALVKLGPVVKAVFDGLGETLVTQLGASFVVPALLWILLAFRASDWRETESGARLGSQDCRPEKKRDAKLRVARAP